MAIALLADAEAQSTNNNTATTAGINTTGASLLVAIICDESNAPFSVLTDSKGNTWIPLTETAVPSGVFNAAKMYYCVPTSVGSGHTVTATASGGSTFPSIWFGAFSGTHPTAPFDAESPGATGTTGSTRQPGSLTPKTSDELFITAANGTGNGAGSINASFIEVADLGESSNADMIHVAYKIQTVPGAENPTWTLSSGVPRVAIMAAFRAIPPPKSGLVAPSYAVHRASRR